MGVGMTVQGASLTATTSLTTSPLQPLPRPPLRMERGVDTTINKQRGHFFDVKRRPFHGKETPSSIGEGRSFLFALSFFANEVLPCYTETIWHRAFQQTTFSYRTNHNFELWIMNFELHLGICFRGFPCSFRNSVLLSGFVPSVYSVLRKASPPPPLRME